MEYKVIHHEVSTCFGAAIKKVEKEVNEYLEKGWSLHGPLTITSHSTSGYLVVAQVITL